MKTIPEEELIEIGESIAAVSALIHENQDNYQDILERLPPEVGGFVGVWELCAKAGYAFYQEAALFAAEEFYWVEAMEGFADQIQNYLLTGTIPQVADLHRLATGNIEKNLERQ